MTSKRKTRHGSYSIRRSTTLHHLTFDDDALIHPVKKDGAPDPRGETSIRVYALQRSHLVHARLVVLNDLKKKIEELVRQVLIK